MGSLPGACYLPSPAPPHVVGRHATPHPRVLFPVTFTDKPRPPHLEATDADEREPQHRPEDEDGRPEGPLPLTIKVDQEVEAEGVTLTLERVVDYPLLP